MSFRKVAPVEAAGKPAVNDTSYRTHRGLTMLKVRHAKPGPKPRRLYDAGGLYLEVAPSGSKWWRLKYRYGGKEKRLSLGVYPAVGLEEARGKREDARRLLKAGTDPGEERKRQKLVRTESLASSFEQVARSFLGVKTPDWVARHSERVMRLFERDIFPWIGNCAITRLTPSEVLTVLRRIEGRGAVDTAHRALGKCSEVFRFAIAEGRIAADPTEALGAALKVGKKDNFPAVKEPDRLAEILRMIDGYQGTLTVCSALRLAPLLFVRPGELRKAEWEDVDLDAEEWRFITSKTATHHVVPLARQAREILADLHKLTGDGRYVFPSARSVARPMSDNAILAAMRSMGLPKTEIVTHGFRATARTILDEVLGFRPDIIEHQLAHRVKDPNGRAYNRTTFLPERKQMMQRWADYLGELKLGTPVDSPHVASTDRSSPK